MNYKNANITSSGSTPYNGLSDLMKDGALTSKVYSIKVDHMESNQRIRLEITSVWTLTQLKDEIANEIEIDPNTIVLIYMDSGFRVKIKTDRILQEALNETNSFIVEGTPIVANGASVPTASYIPSVLTDSASAEANKVFYSVTVDHLESNQRIEMQLNDPGMTLKEFQGK
ncbi:hypothetical protein HDU76_006454, partial [Blyttiomyces sp. JEL0837]